MPFRSGGGAGRHRTAALGGDSDNTSPYWAGSPTPRSQSASSRDRHALSQHHYQQPAHHLPIQHPHSQSITQLSRFEHSQRGASYHSSVPRTDSFRSDNYHLSTSAPPSLDAPLSVAAEPTTPFWNSVTPLDASNNAVQLVPTYSQPSSDLSHHSGFESASRLPIHPHFQQFHHPDSQSHQYLPRNQDPRQPSDHMTEYGLPPRPNRLSFTSTSSSGPSYYSPDLTSPIAVQPSPEEHGVPRNFYSAAGASDAQGLHAGHPAHVLQPSISAQASYPKYPGLEGYSSTMPPQYSGYGDARGPAGAMTFSTAPYGDARFSYLVPIEVKHRRRTTKAQFEVLEGTFQQVTKPNAALRKSLSLDLDMPPRAIQIWFQNRRAKAKSAAKGNTSMDSAYDTPDRSTANTSTGKGKERSFPQHEEELDRRNTGASSHSEPGSFVVRPGQPDDRSSDASNSDQSHISVNYPSSVPSHIHGREDRYPALHDTNSYSSHGSSSSSAGGEKLGYRMASASSLSSLGSMSMYTAPSSASASSSSASHDRIGSQNSSAYGYGIEAIPLSTLENESVFPLSKSKGIHRRAQSISHHSSSATLSAHREPNLTPALEPAPATSVSGSDARRLSWSSSPAITAGVPPQTPPTTSPRMFARENATHTNLDPATDT